VLYIVESSERIITRCECSDAISEEYLHVYYVLYECTTDVLYDVLRRIVILRKIDA
jgi:hypothetical protein